MIAILSLLLAGCPADVKYPGDTAAPDSADTDVDTAAAPLLTAPPLVDFGLALPGAEVSDAITLSCASAVLIDAVTLEGEDGVFTLPSWHDGDTLPLVPGFPTSLDAAFTPPEVGAYRALVAIHWTDGSGLDGTARVVLRGLSRAPCMQTWPAWIDYGRKAMGGYFPGYVQVVNCGVTSLTIEGFDVAGSRAFYVATPVPVHIPSGRDPVEIEIGWIPGATTAQAADVTLLTADPDVFATVHVVGNDCAASADPSWDADNDGWFLCGGDCDDADPTVHPNAPEAMNGVDDDCDGVREEVYTPIADADADGVTIDDGDCDDQDAAVHPGAAEVFNQVDDDCNGAVDDTTEAYDDDGDGLSERAGDCADADPTVHPSATEETNGVDDDCDGIIDEGGPDADDDGDGWTETEGDCADADPWSFPLAAEDCDTVDNDCDAEIDEDGACGVSTP